MAKKTKTTVAGAIGHMAVMGAELQRGLEQAHDDLRTINQLIYSVGAPLGSAQYFQIREIAAKYEKKGA